MTSKARTHKMSAQPTIFSLEEALLNVKDGSRGKYRKCWNDFTSFFPLKKDEFSLGMPCEEDFTSYFKHLREEKKMASSSLWTYYSMLNSVVKGIYGKKLQTEFPRLTSFIKAYDTDIKKKHVLWTWRYSRIRKERQYFYSILACPESCYDCRLFWRSSPPWMHVFVLGKSFL